MGHSFIFSPADILRHMGHTRERTPEQNCADTRGDPETVKKKDMQEKNNHPIQEKQTKLYKR